jgi:DNA-binding protein HU-beta
LFLICFASKFASILFLITKNTEMNKGELIEAIAKGSGLSKADAGRALDATLDAVTKTLKKGDRVSIPGFGSFSISKRSARTGRNPQTGETIKIKARKVAKFKAGTKLAEAVN